MPDDNDDPKIYAVTIEAEVLVTAPNASEARSIAKVDADPVEYYCSAKELKSPYLPPGWSGDAIPYGVEHPKNRDLKASEWFEELFSAEEESEDLNEDLIEYIEKQEGDEEK